MIILDNIILHMGHGRHFEAFVGRLAHKHLLLCIFYVLYRPTIQFTPMT